MCCPGSATRGDAGSQQLGRAAALPATAFASSSSLWLWSLVGQSREKMRRRRSLPHSQTLLGQPLREGRVEPALEVQPGWWGFCGPKKRMLKMTAKEIVFGNTREITSCSSEIDFSLFFIPLCLFLFFVWKCVHESKKNFQLQFRNGRSQSKLFRFVSDSSNLITSSGTWSKAHWINFLLILLRLLGQAQNEVFKRAAAFRRREGCWVARVAACSHWDRYA